MMKQLPPTTTIIRLLVVVALSSAVTVVSAFAPSSSSLLLPSSTFLCSSSSSSSSNQDDQQQLPTSSSSSSDEEFTIEGYSRCLSPWEAKQSVKQESNQYSIIDRRPKWEKPLQLLSKPFKRLLMTRTRKKKPGSLILLRCGESKWTKTGRFTGWGELVLYLLVVVYIVIYYDVLIFRCTAEDSTLTWCSKWHFISSSIY